MADADFSGVLNPKRTLAKRMAESEDVGAVPTTASTKVMARDAEDVGAMGQSQFGGKRSPAEQMAQQKKLADMLKNRK